jgi:hypothetical protein
MIEPLEQWFAREVLAHEPSLMTDRLRRSRITFSVVW